MATSDWLERVRRKHIVRPVMDDARERGVPNTRLGYPINWIFSHVVGGGQADFDKPIGDISAAERVLLYAFLLQPGHVGELVTAFGKLLPEASQFNNATVLDIGCGPFTAGLSLADIVGQGAAFRYFGVDISERMMEFGGQLASAAKAEGGLHPDTVVAFENSLDKIHFGKQRTAWTFVILSYLLKSASINVADLVRQIVDACMRIGPGPVALLYTNSARPEASAAFPEFRALMLAAGFAVKVDEVGSVWDGRKNRETHYALFVRLVPTYSIGAFV